MFLKNNEKSENVLILGLGGVGFYLAKRLSHEGYTITVIEKDSDRIGYAASHIVARLIQGDSLNMECWRGANAEEMDFLFAVKTRT